VEVRDRVSRVVGFVAVAVAIAACGGTSSPAANNVHVEPEATFALPPVTLGCHGATSLPGGGTRVPLKVSTQEGQVAEAVNICIDGKGPFPFVLDSGAGESTIDAHLAKRLQLPSDGASSKFAGVGCTGTAQPVSVNRWSVEGLDLAQQQLTAATLPGIGGKGEPDGLLGSDVLSRFGSVRVDFQAGELLVPGPEGPALSGSAPVVGPVGPPPPPVLTGNGQGSTIPIVVTTIPGDVALNVAVHFGTGPDKMFTVDTGSSQSVVATSVAQSQSLTHTDLASRQATVCSTITVPLVHSGPWSLPSFPLTPQLLGATAFGDVGVGGVVGLLGSDQLKHYGWVVFDYAGGRMVLG
jgi:hypothetical protein